MSLETRSSFARAAAARSALILRGLPVASSAARGEMTGTMAALWA